jgi:hypothetical protein
MFLMAIIIDAIISQIVLTVFWFGSLLQEILSYLNINHITARLTVLARYRDVPVEMKWALSRTNNIAISRVVHKQKYVGM